MVKVTIRKCIPPEPYKYYVVVDEILGERTKNIDCAFCEDFVEMVEYIATFEAVKIDIPPGEILD